MAKISINSFLTGRGTDRKENPDFDLNIVPITEYADGEYPHQGL